MKEVKKVGLSRRAGAKTALNGVATLDKPVSLAGVWHLVSTRFGCQRGNEHVHDTREETGEADAPPAPCPDTRMVERTA